MTAKNKLDAEYVAMRRRMSRLRVNCSQKASLEAEDTPKGGDDPGFKDLIKYWKKHGIPIPKDLMSDMNDEHVNQAVAKGRGRRKSRELEDLHFCASTGKFNLEKLAIPEDEETKTPPLQKRSTGMGTPPQQKRSTSTETPKPRMGSLKGKSQTRSNIFSSAPKGLHPTKKLVRTQSNYK